jgi:uncharacterized protein (DUF952 family)
VLIYKILLPAEWAEFEAAGRFDGSPLDRESGFVHFSARAQVGMVARALFAEEPMLVVAAVDADAVGEALRWEPTPDGELFPHVYASVPRDAVVAVHTVGGAAAVDASLLAQ